MTPFETIITALLLGNYGYTWYSIRSLWQAWDKMRDNEIEHLKAELAKLKKEVQAT